MKDLKGFGYGAPYSIEFSVDGEAKHVILETIRPGSFGHDYFSDRAAVLLWQIIESIESRMLPTQNSSPIRKVIMTKASGTDSF